MSLKSRVCDILGIEYPIVLAGMGGASNPKLAAAVSNAGGLGVLGAAGCGPDMLRQWISETREMTDKPFGVDTLLPASVRRGKNIATSDGESPMDKLGDYKQFASEFMAQEGLELPPQAGTAPSGNQRVTFSKEFFEEQMAVIVEEKVPVYAAGLGNPGPWMEDFRRNGTKVMAVVGAVRHARQVATSGLDIIVAQGHDAGGHNSPVGTMALIPQVVDALGGDIPVLGAGGITDGRGVAAAMMLGAEGAWVGSAFLAAEESGIQDFQRQAIVDATEEGTTISRSVTGKPARIIRSKWTQAWENAEIEPLPMPFQGMISGPVMQAANRAGRQDINPGFAGQGIGMIGAVRPAAEIFEDLVKGAERTLSNAGRFVS
ncbi:MAG: nitronate monooxygenase family protein [Pseudomonadota bacterium]